MRYQVVVVVALVCVGLIACQAETAETRLTAFPENHSTLTVLQDGEPYLEIALMGWEPGWKYRGVRGGSAEAGEGTLLENSAKTAGGAELSVEV